MVDISSDFKVEYIKNGAATNFGQMFLTLTGKQYFFPTTWQAGLKDSAEHSSLSNVDLREKVELHHI